MYDNAHMVAPKLGKLLEVSEEAVRAMRVGASTLREAHLHGSYLEVAATKLDAARNLKTHEDLAGLLAVAGRSVRAMQGAADILREGALSGSDLEDAAVKLAKALHDAGQDTVPIAVSDVLKDE